MSPGGPVHTYGLAAGTHTLTLHHHLLHCVGTSYVIVRYFQWGYTNVLTKQ
jgi:hypothetical protein